MVVAAWKSARVPIDTVGQRSLAAKAQKKNPETCQ
jgi:hypothetical protein